MSYARRTNALLRLLNVKYSHDSDSCAVVFVGKKVHWSQTKSFKTVPSPGSSGLEVMTVYAATFYCFYISLTLLFSFVEASYIVG